MARRRRWTSTVFLILMVALELLDLSWSYEAGKATYGSRMSGDYSLMQRAWRVRGRKGRGNAGGNHGRGHNGGRGFGRNRFMLDREEGRGERFRQNRRLSTPQASRDGFVTLESCCPTVFEIVEPLAGKNRSGHLVDLYRDDDVRQRFYEVSCGPNVANKPCRFLENRHSRFSTCIQQFSYTYALVRPTDPSPSKERPYYLDYISIRSGCACQVGASRRRKKQRGEF